MLWKHGQDVGVFNMQCMIAFSKSFETCSVQWQDFVQGNDFPHLITWAAASTIDQCQCTKPGRWFQKSKPKWKMVKSNDNPADRGSVSSSTQNYKNIKTDYFAFVWDFWECIWEFKPKQVFMSQIKVLNMVHAMLPSIIHLYTRR
jgi:hypothetical protein